MSDTSLVGLQGPMYTMPLELGKSREFARAVYAQHPAYLSGSSSPIHTTFLTTAGVSWGYTLERPRGTVFERIDHDLSVPLHAEEAYVFHGPPPRVGTSLEARSTLESLTHKEGKRGGRLTFLVMLTEFWNQAGTLIAEARSTTVTTERSPQDDDWNVTLPKYEPRYEDDGNESPFKTVAAQAWEQLREGAGPGAVTTGPLTLREIVRYQGACGEDNPLHYDAVYARSMGYPAPFAIGMQQAGALASYAVWWLGPENVRNFEARFVDVVWPGDTLSYDGTLVRKYMSDGRRYADVELVCRRVQGAPVTRVRMSFELP